MSWNIAIDGPAGAGKSTIARQIAEKLGMIYVDTGAMYRAMGLYFHRQGIDAKQEEAISREAEKARVTIRYENGRQQVFLNGENVTAWLRTEEAGRMASAVSIYPAVRKNLVKQQQQLAAEHDVVMDGRDIGTVVLPRADLKIYLTADSRVRAKRRCAELREKGCECDLDAVEKDIIERDYQDMHRTESPLKQAEDAVLVDTSQMDIGQVVETVIGLFQNRADR